ncbi:unnamed protein product [Mytilus coruscus]|uniref:CCHC-type domain-containing protein n=1 Tax=Mytilus coruscus TaxID=42192 RepID=A0A6J8ENG7_MYTCO|nr:unnamed protein product [Mytilus coruscus]
MKNKGKKRNEVILTPQGNALNVYALLPSDQALDYDALRTCLLKRFNITEDGFKQKFRSCRPESERVLKSVDEMTRYADQFKEIRRVNKVSLTNQTQKGKSQPPQKPNKVRNQEMPKVSDRDRNRHTGGNGGNRFDRKCFKCNKSDDLISNCPFLRNKASNVQNSGSRGKETPDCNNVITLTDSIITTQVSSPMIPAECEKKPIKMPVAKGKLGDRVVTTCILAEGSSAKVPIAIITIDSPYYQGEVQAWCMEQPLYDVIKGNIDGAKEPYDPIISPSVSVVTRQQAKQRDNPYSKLKVPGSIKDVSLEDKEREQQSDESLMKLRQYVAEGRNFEKTSGTKVNYIVKKKTYV